MTGNKIGLIAGEGKMPVYIAQKAKAKGFEVYVAGAKGNAKEEDYKNRDIVLNFSIKSPSSFVSGTFFIPCPLSP